MTVLANPIVLQMLLLFIFGASAFILGVLIMRRLRQRLTGNPLPPPTASADSPGFAFAAYNAVIQQLNESQQELRRLRQEASQRATATENISAAVINNLASGVVLFNSAGLVQQANPAAREILGYASVAGLHARDLFRGVSALRSETPEDQPGSMTEVIDLSLSDARVWRGLEADYATPSAQQRVLGITVSPVTAAAGERLGAACLVSDLTEVRRLARQVQLRESLAALGEMSAGIAHEFKNSLATISGYSQMLAGDNDPATARQFAAKIAAETQALSRVVNDFLNFARPQALVAEPVALAPLLEACAAECGVELDQGALPADLTLLGDPGALRSCFANLLRNSAEAAHGVPVRVEISGQVESGQARIVVRDNAGGIDPKALPHIFIPFTTTKANGTGLGLALVHRIVADHGGSITAGNEGAGAAFTVVLPAQKLAKKAAEPG